MNVAQPGQIIAGKYRVERVLGQGGMGVVLLAMHDALDQRVAVKIMNPDAAAEQEWVTRFQREARLAAKIKSEHVVRVFDVGRLDNGAPFMVMEYLEGKDLQDLLTEKKRLSVEETSRYVLQVSEALAEAHALGIVHRDLKPANLFVAKRTDGSPCVKILDFGISKVSSTITGEVTMTSTSAIVGSPLYMSPEQMKASKNVDRRADIWSLGIILQELSTGMPSFVANTTAELCALVLTSAPTPVRDTLPNAPARFEAVVQKCLQREPKDRFQSIGELAHALAEFVPNSQESIERIERITKKGEANVLGSDPTVSEPVRTDALIALDRTEVSDSGARPVITSNASAPPKLVLAETAQSAGNSPVATNAAWGAPAAPAPKSKALVFVGAAIGGLAGVAVLALLIGRSVSTTSTPSAEPTKLATTAPTVASATVAHSTIAAPVISAPQAVSATVLAVDALPTSKPAIAAPPVAVKDAGVTKPAASAKPHVAPVDTSGFGGRN